MSFAFYFRHYGLYIAYYLLSQLMVLSWDMKRGLKTGQLTPSIPVIIMR